MAIDVSKMSASELNKLSAKIKRRQRELTHHEALAQMKAVAKKHGVDFVEVVRLHSAKLPKAKAKTTRKATSKTAIKTTAKTGSKATPKGSPNAITKVAAKKAAKAATKPTRATKGAPKPKYKNPDNPKQTWSGRGRKPAWFIAHIDAGKRLEGLTA